MVCVMQDEWFRKRYPDLGVCRLIKQTYRVVDFNVGTGAEFGKVMVWVGRRRG